MINVDLIDDMLGYMGHTKRRRVDESSTHDSSKPGNAPLNCGCITNEQVLTIAATGDDFVVSEDMLSQRGTWIKTSTYKGIKVIVKKSNALTGVKRESLEAKAMRAACGHANIAKLYGDAIVQDDAIASLRVGFGVPKQHLMMVMEYLTPSYGGIDKLNLYSEQYCEENKLSVPMIFSHICKHIGSAMHHLYENNYLHRDVKLRNTAFEIVNGDIVFKLIDFGSAMYNVPRRDIGWSVDKQDFREMIMSILTWNVLPNRTKTKRIIINDEYTQVVDDKGEKVDTPLAFPWLALDDIITYVCTSPLKDLEADAQRVRKYDESDVKKTSRNTDLMTMTIGDIDTYFVERHAAF